MLTEDVLASNRLVLIVILITQRAENNIDTIPNLIHVDKSTWIY